MKFIMFCCNKGDYKKVWTEEYDSGDVLPWDYANNMINNYNDTLKPGEVPRQLLVIKKGGSAILKHDWVKKSLVTHSGGYDIYECRSCGAMGKRYGLSATVTLDKRYKKECSCD